MAIRERLVYAIDIVTDGANKGLKNFRTAVGDAEGATGKFKAGASSAFSTIQANAGTLALAGGTALVAFGTKAVNSFTEGALAAGKFADATGLATEDASRWVEVASDLGVSAEQVSGGFIKLEKAIASGSPAADELGLSLQRTADGAVDVNGTMLEAIRLLGEVEDPAKKAQLAAQLFGKGFGDMAEIVLGDADDIKKRLGEVSDAQVFDKDEVKNARELRDSIDNVKDKFEQLSLELGGALAPAISDVADSLTELVEIADAVKVPELLKFGVENTALNRTRQLGEAIAGIFTDDAEQGSALFQAGIDGVVQALEDAEQATKDHAAAVEGGNPAFSLYVENAEHAAEAVDAKAEADARAAEAADRHREALDAVADAMEAQRDAALDLVGGDIAVRDAQRRAAEAAEELNDVLADQETSFADAGAAVDEAADAQLNAASAAADYRAKQMEANGQAVDAQVKAQLLKEELQNLTGNLTGPLLAAIQGYIDQLNAIPKTIGTTIVLTQQGRVGDTVVANRLGGGIQRFASGGVVDGPIGKPQLAIVEGGETVLPTHRSGVSVGGGGSYTINMYGTEATPAAVIDAIKKWERLNGTNWRA